MWLPGYQPLVASKGEAFTFSFPIICCYLGYIVSSEIDLFAKEEKCISYYFSG